MKRGYLKAIADEGKVFVDREYGYEKTPEAVKKEREAGKPVKGFEHSVPLLWIEKGYVVEQEEA